MLLMSIIFCILLSCDLLLRGLLSIDGPANVENFGIAIAAPESTSVMRDANWNAIACVSTPVAISCLVFITVFSMSPASATASKLMSSFCGTRPTFTQKNKENHFIVSLTMEILMKEVESVCARVERGEGDK